MIWTIPDKNKVVLYVAALCEFYGLQRAFGFVREVHKLSPVPVFRQDWKLDDRRKKPPLLSGPDPLVLLMFARVCSCLLVFAHVC